MIKVKSHYEKYGINLRLVEIQDAPFICKLRSDELLGKYLSETSDRIDYQEEWIRQYKVREREGKEYYFVTMDTEGNKFGTTRLYNFKLDSFTVGSWLFARNAPLGMAIKADLITREIGFFDLGFTCCEFDVRKDNINVIKYHKAFGPVKIGENEWNYFYSIDYEKFCLRRDKLLNIL